MCFVRRLSERNCIEIVQCLVELKLLDVIHTTDGKEYLTPNELGKEIREELIVQGGIADYRCDVKMVTPLYAFRLMIEFITA